MARGSDVLDTMPVSPWAPALRWLLRIWAGLIVVFLYAPIALLILFSFEDSQTPGFPITGLTFRWYQDLPENTPLLSAVVTSVTIALVVSLASTLIGTMAAFPLVRANLSRPYALRVLLTMPIMLPGLIIGVGILVLLAGILSIQLSLLTVIAGHLVLTIPFAVLIVSARLQGFDRRLEWAAADLGAGPVRTLRYIVLPLIAPAILAAALISVSLSIDEFVVTFWTIGSQLTLPIYIYTQIKFGVTPEINAVATLLLLGTAATFAIGALVATMVGRLRRGVRQRRAARLEGR
jgi:spermidine/putrescine transport system permease protein